MNAKSEAVTIAACFEAINSYTRLATQWNSTPMAAYYFMDRISFCNVTRSAPLRGVPGWGAPLQLHPRVTHWQWKHDTSTETLISTKRESSRCVFFGKYFFQNYRNKASLHTNEWRDSSYHAFPVRGQWLKFLFSQYSHWLCLEPQALALMMEIYECSHNISECFLSVTAKWMMMHKSSPFGREKDPGM